MKTKSIVYKTVNYYRKFAGQINVFIQINKLIILLLYVDCAISDHYHFASVSSKCLIDVTPDMYGPVIGS